MISFSSFFKLPHRQGGFSFSHVNREAVVAWGVAAAFLLCLFLLSWDAYIFFTSSSPDVSAPYASIKKSLLTEEELDEAVEFLDAREKKIQEILAQ